MRVFMSCRVAKKDKHEKRRKGAKSAPQPPIPRFDTHDAQIPKPMLHKNTQQKNVTPSPPQPEGRQGSGLGPGQEGAAAQAGQGRPERFEIHCPGTETPLLGALTALVSVAAGGVRAACWCVDSAHICHVSLGERQIHNTTVTARRVRSVTSLLLHSSN